MLLIMLYDMNKLVCGEPFPVFFFFHKIQHKVNIRFLKPRNDPNVFTIVLTTFSSFFFFIKYIIRFLKPRNDPNVFTMVLLTYYLGAPTFYY